MRKKWAKIQFCPAFLGIISTFPSVVVRSAVVAFASFDSPLALAEPLAHRRSGPTLYRGATPKEAALQRHSLGLLALSHPNQSNRPITACALTLDKRAARVTAFFAFSKQGARQDLCLSLHAFGISPESECLEVSCQCCPVPGRRGVKHLDRLSRTSDVV